MKKDRLYQNSVGTIQPFEFDDRVAEVFPDMIRRSVPGYTQTLAMLSVVASGYARVQTKLYDLGCSLGASTLAMAQSVEQDGCRIVAVDNSEPMLNRCKQNLSEQTGTCPVDVVLSDIQDIEVVNASVVVMNFTLQFIPLLQREKLLQDIYNGLNAGGVLFLSEKIRMESELENEQMIQLHHQYKRLNGYDEMEIAGKRTALENVLIPETLSLHRQRLQSIGFSQISVCMQCFNFVSILAVK